MVKIGVHLPNLSQN